MYLARYFANEKSIENLAKRKKGLCNPLLLDDSFKKKGFFVPDLYEAVF